jgi:hypothetical protein
VFVPAFQKVKALQRTAEERNEVKEMEERETGVDFPFDASNAAFTAFAGCPRFALVY